MALRVRRVARVDTPVMFVPAQDESDEIGAAWDRLESALGSLRGRRFFGAFDDGGTYRCCVQVRDGDDATRLGVESGVIPGGWYLCATLRGPQPAAYALLTPTFAELRQLAQRDATRPSIEYYRRHDRIDLLLPVTETHEPRCPQGRMTLPASAAGRVPEAGSEPVGEVSLFALDTVRLAWISTIQCPNLYGMKRGEGTSVPESSARRRTTDGPVRAVCSCGDTGWIEAAIVIPAEDR